MSKENLSMPLRGFQVCLLLKPATDFYLPKLTSNMYCIDDDDSFLISKQEKVLNFTEALTGRNQTTSHRLSSRVDELAQIQEKDDRFEQYRR